MACAQPLSSTIIDDTGGQSNGGRGGSVNGAGTGGSLSPSAGSPSAGDNGGSLAAANGGLDELGGMSGSAGSDEAAGAAGSTAGSVTAGTAAGGLAGSGGTVATGGAAAGTAGAGGGAATGGVTAGGAGAGGTGAGGEGPGGGAGMGGAGGAGCTLSVTYAETRLANDYPLATFTLTNNGAAFPLSQLGLRYYFNSELNAGGTWTAPITVQQFNNPPSPANVATGGSAVVLANPAAPQGNDSTVVLSFSSTEVFSPARALTVQFYLVPSSYTVAPDQSNDWSFVQGHTGLWDPPHITLALNGVQVCGVAP